MITGIQVHNIALNESNMKNHLTLYLLLIGLFCTTQAQVTITQHNIGPIGTQITNWDKESPVPAAVPGSSGSNVSWDFSSLSNNDGSHTDFLVDPNSLPEGSQFPTANIAFNEPSLNFRTYMKATPDSVVVVGVSTDIGLQGNSIIWTSGELFVKVPMNMNDFFTRSFTREVREVSGSLLPANFDSIYLKSNILLNDTIDGFGSLILPEHGTGAPISFSTLRKVKWEHRVDSSFGRDTTNGWTFLNEDIYSTLIYEWWEPFQGRIAVAEMEQGNLSVVDYISFQDLDITVGIAAKEVERLNFNVSPNPISSNTKANFYLDHAAKASLQILDIHGKRIIDIQPESVGIVGQNSISLARAAESLAPGAYFVILQMDHKAIGISKILKN